MNGEQLIYSVCLAGGIDLATLRAVVSEWLPHTNLKALPLCLCIQASTWELCIPRSAGLQAVNDLEARLRFRVPTAAVGIMALKMNDLLTTETVSLSAS
jgi:hypothetical protein